MSQCISETVRVCVNCEKQFGQGGEEKCRQIVVFIRADLFVVRFHEQEDRECYDSKDHQLHDYFERSQTSFGEVAVGKNATSHQQDTRDARRRDKYPVEDVAPFAIWLLYCQRQAQGFQRPSEYPELRRLIGGPVLKDTHAFEG